MLSLTAAKARAVARGEGGLDRPRHASGRPPLREALLVTPHPEAVPAQALQHRLQPLDRDVEGPGKCPERYSASGRMSSSTTLPAAAPPQHGPRHGLERALRVVAGIKCAEQTLHLRDMAFRDLPHQRQ